MAGAYKLFSNEKAAEQAGILINYGDFRLRIARAGGGNQKFRRLLQAKLKPYRHQIDNDTLSDIVSEALLREAYAEAVVLGWETRVGEGEAEKWEPWLETPAGNVEYSAEACVKVLTDLPDLFRDVQTMAGKAANFKRAEEEEDAKN